MGKCIHCGRRTWFFEKEHESCARDRYIAERFDEIVEVCVAAVLKGESLNGLPKRISETAYKVIPSWQVNSDHINFLLIRGWINSVEAAMADGSLSETEFQGLNRYRHHFNLEETELDVNGYFSYFKRASLLKFLALDGIVPRFDRNAARRQHGRIPFNLVKNEELIWLVTEVPYGLGKKPDTGFLGITTKHLYFTGSINSFRIQLERIVSLKEYTDGIGINRETSPSYQEIFRMSGQDAWLIANLVDALMAMDKIQLPKRDSPTLDDLVNSGFQPNDEGEVEPAQ